MTPTRRLLLPLALALLASLLVFAPADAAKGSCGRASGCNKFELLHAGSTYKWYPETKRYEFKTSAGATPPAVWSKAGTPSLWVAGKPGHGTLTTATEGTNGDAISDWNKAWSTGRWEVRFRSITKPKKALAGARPYQVKIELVPGASRGARCAPESITVASYDMASDRQVHLGLTRAASSSGTTRSTTGPLFDVNTWRAGQSLTTSAWHTFAAEVAADHISWFIDGKVVATEKRPALLFATPLHLRISLLAPAGATATVPAVTQLDWARYWKLGKYKKKTVKVKKHGKVTKRKKKVLVYKGVKKAKILKAPAPTLGAAAHPSC